MALPFWDQPAIQKISTRDPITGKTSDGEARPSGITNVTPDVEFPYPDELSPWDVIFLNGKRAPGICRLEGGRHLALDVKRAIGMMLPTIAVLNFDPVPITLTLTLWTPAQFAALQAMLVNILPPASPNPVLRAVTAEHPALALIGCHTLLFQGMELPRHVGHQICEVSFNAYEFSPDIPYKAADVESAIPDALRVSLQQQPPIPLAPSQQKLGP